jgi:hypothetical protein
MRGHIANALTVDIDFAPVTQRFQILVAGLGTIVSDSANIFRFCRTHSEECTQKPRRRKADVRSALAALAALTPDD